MPALPTTNLIRHFDASTAADLYKTYASNLLQDHPADGENIIAWDDSIDTATGALQVVMGIEGTTPDVRWRDDSTMPLPSLEILDGKMRLENNSNSSVGSAPANTSGYTVLLSFVIGSTGTYSNDATKYFNCTLVGGERNTYSSVYIRKDGSDYYLTAYNWDGNADTVELQVTPDEPHTLCVRHESGTLYLSVDCGSEVSVASGTTSNQTIFCLGDQGVNSGTTNNFRGRIGELAIYDAGLTGSALADACEYFCDRWLIPDTIVCAYALGQNVTVTSSNTMAVNLDEVTRELVPEVEGSIALGGNLLLWEQSSAPSAIANSGRIYAEDNGAGKTRVMVQFGTGSPVQIAIEP